MKYDVNRNDYDTTGEWMVAAHIADLIADYEFADPLPSKEEIDKAIDTANAGTALGEYIGAAWEAAREIVYDEFPQFRAPEEVA